jgi:hypothetical protein
MKRFRMKEINEIVMENQGAILIFKDIVTINAKMPM